MPACGDPLSVMTVLAYGADMAPTIRERADRSQNAFGADLIEALTACTELINTGRSPAGEGLRGVADVASFGRRYAFAGRALPVAVSACRAVEPHAGRSGR